jgi:hypothetical protein
MPIEITQLNDSAKVTEHQYQYMIVAVVGGRNVRAGALRDKNLNESRAVAEVLTDRHGWITVTVDAPGNWWHTTPSPKPGVDAAGVLRRIVKKLLIEAGRILATQPITQTLSVHLCRAINALLATTCGPDGEVSLDPNKIVSASEKGGTLHVVEHWDGTVTFTKAHRSQCPFITSAGAQRCDGECSQAVQ